MKQDLKKMPLTFKDELTSLINKYSLENASNTPDFIIAQYLIECLDSYNLATMLRNKWYGSSIDNVFDKEVT